MPCLYTLIETGKHFECDTLRNGNAIYASLHTHTPDRIVCIASRDGQLNVLRQILALPRDRFTNKLNAKLDAVDAILNPFLEPTLSRPRA